MHVCDVRNREFEIPSGFEPVKGSSAITREAVLSEDKELWFFKLPKHVRYCILFMRGFHCLHYAYFAINQY